MRHRLVLAAAVLVATAACSQTGAPAPEQAAPAQVKAIQGVWRTTEIRTTGPDAMTISPAQPGLVMFTNGYYSITRVNSQDPRPDPGDVAAASADTLRAAWGPFTSQAGTYEVADGMVTTRPQVAKNPPVMDGTRSNTFSYMVDGNTLTMTGTANQAGPTENPTTWVYTRVE